MAWQPVSDDDLKVLHCGCVLYTAIDKGVKTFMMTPCHLNCANYRNAIQMAHEKGVPVEFRER